MDDTIPQDVPQKQCYRCGETFPATRQFFFVNKKAKDGLLTRCKTCSEHRTQPRYQAKEGYKRCSHCKIEFPLTNEYFHVDNSQPDHFDYSCKQCVLAKSAQRYVEAKQNVQSGIPAELICRKCGCTKPLTEEYFYKDPVRRYGLTETCKTCKNAQIKAYRTEHPEIYKEQWQRQRHLRKDKNVAYYLTHKEKWVDSGRRRRREKGEQIREQKRRYFQTERGKLAQRTASRNRKARNKGAEGKFTGQDVQRQLKAQHNKCYWCQDKLAKYHIDHIVPLSRGGTNCPDNLVVSCPTCNLRKNNKYPHEWIEGGRLL